MANTKTKHIGIVGCSAGGAALCYQTICEQGDKLFGTHAHPEVSMHTHSLADYVNCIDENDWQGVSNLMLSSANKLAKIGADFLICPDNTIHQALPFIKESSPRPWLHIAEVVAKEAKNKGYNRVGLTGTRWLVESNTYPDKLAELDINYVCPDSIERVEINRIIMDELVTGVLKPESIKYFQKVIEGLKNKGCDAVVLGCTEIPLIINDSNSTLPTLDSTRLLAHAALEFARYN